MDYFDAKHAKLSYDFESREKYLDIPFKESEYQERLRKIRGMMQDKDLSALLVYSYPGGSDGYGHLTYLSSLYLIGGDAVILLSPDDEPKQFYDRLFHNEPLHSYIWTTWIRDTQPSKRPELSDNMVEWFKEADVENGRVGLVGESMIPWDIWKGLRQGLPEVEWIHVSKAYNEIQKIKSEDEMKLIKKVCNMTDKGMEAGVEAVKKGVTEGEVVGEIHRELARQGAHDLSFNSCIASGPRGGLKHSYPTERKISDGDLVYLDIGARYYGYHTDMSRVVMVGDPSNKQKEVLECVRNAYYTLLDVMEPGIHVDELIALSRELGSKSGLLERYKGKIYMDLAAGHGMSTGFAEWRPNDGDTVLTKNISPLAFEPMITILDFGISVIESMIGITDKGAEVLTPLELDWM